MATSDNGDHFGVQKLPVGVNPLLTASLPHPKGISYEAMRGGRIRVRYTPVRGYTMTDVAADPIEAEQIAIELAGEL